MYTQLVHWCRHCCICLICKYTQVHIDTVIQSSGSYEGGLSGEVPLGRRRIHGHPPPRFGWLVYNNTRLCTKHAQKVLVRHRSSRLAHMCSNMHIVVQSLQRRFYLQRPQRRPHTVRPRPLLIWANDPSTSACWVGWEGSPLSWTTLSSSSLASLSSQLGKLIYSWLSVRDPHCDNDLHHHQH